jgi:hypothetical protein
MPNLFGQPPYNRNESRSWPLTDNATAIDDSGNRLPQSILVDLQLALPSTLGDVGYIAGLTVGPTFATLVVATPTGPVAALTVTKAPLPYQTYQLTPLVPGVAGWAVFGSGALRAYCGRYSTATQTQLLPRCMTPYQLAPVTALGREAADAPLTGLITLEAGEDLEIIPYAVISETFSNR